MSPTVFADTAYLGLYLRGSKIGYASYRSDPAIWAGKRVTKSESRTVLDATLLGSPITVSVDSATWATASGQPLRILSTTRSGGRLDKVDAAFAGGFAILHILIGAVSSQRKLALPAGAAVVDDPLSLVLHGKLPRGTTRCYYVLDPSTASFLKTTVEVVGPARTSAGGKAWKANLIRLTDARSETDVFVNSSGDVLRVDGPMGIVMLPVSKRVALAQPDKYHPSPDLAATSSLRPDKQIEDAEHLTQLSVRIVGSRLDGIPSDAGQSATKSPQGWTLDVHPPRLAERPTGSIKSAAAAKSEWLLPSLYIPSDNLQFRLLAAKIIGAKNVVQEAAFAIQNYVYENMKPNAGIGVLRDATEILRTKEGVCRDYAVLTVTLLRAAGVPARLASGLVDWDDGFYYHAWAEAWDGRQWIGVDSTTARAQLSASHIKLGEGNVDTAFAFTFLDHAKIEVLGVGKD